MQGASPLASPGLNPFAALVRPAPGERTISNAAVALATDSSISPGPPSPWLPALPIENRLLSFLRRTAGSAPRRLPALQVEPVPRRFSPLGYLFGRLCKCRRRFTVIPAFSAKSAHGNAISFIQKQCPLLFPLLAHSRHGNQSSFPAENIKTTGKIHEALFVSFLGAKIGVNIPF